MLWIITEDSSSGYHMYDLLIRAYNYEDKVKLVSSHGNGLLFKKLSNLVTNANITSFDKVLIACDKIIETDGYSNGELSEGQKLINLLMKCGAFLKSKGIKYSVTNYTSVEELFLSFKYLLDFCGTRNSKDKGILKYIELYDDLYPEIVGGTNYFEVVLPNLSDNITLENYFSTLLSNISGHPKFKNFQIKDKNLGVCWEYGCSECAYVKMGTDKVQDYCEKHNIDMLKVVDLSDKDGLFNFVQTDVGNRCKRVGVLSFGIQNKCIVPYDRSYSCKKCVIPTYPDKYEDALERFRFVVNNSKIVDVKARIDSLLK